MASSELTSRLEDIAEKARQGLSVKDKARERTLSLSRETVRHCSASIRAVHRQEQELARELLGQARNLLQEMSEAIADFSDLSGTGYVQTAQREYAEGCLTLSLVVGSHLPSPEELGVSLPAYLNGMGEAAGELRRYLLDGIRRSDLSRSEELLSAMDDIYGVLVTMDFPDALTGGLRRTTDMVRGVLEKTRGDLTVASEQKNLQAQMAALEERLGLSA
ncbi:MAG: haloacid dehalogenase [Dehalococcoidia bacterium]|jgi:translin|nr:haloacid dehalogenase [Dehalococcoidia bacterium]